MKHTYVPPSGNIKAKMGICAEQPGIEEIRHIPPKPLVGPAGKANDECLQLARIIRSDLYLTNVIKDLDRPIKHYINIDKYGKSTISEEGNRYINELADELKKLNLNVIVAYGNVALLALTSRVGITKWRGSVIESTIVPGLKVVPTFHPATFIPPKFNFLNKPLIVHDLIRAKNEAEFPEIRRIARRIDIKPSFSQAIQYLEFCYEKGISGTIIDIDIEVINEELDCFSVAYSPLHSMSIPFRYSQGDYFTPDQEYEIMLVLAKIIQDDRIAKRGAYFIFDLQYLFRKYGILPRGEIHCTQIAQKISYPDFPAGLDFVTTMHTDIPYYKQDGKKWMKTGTGTWEEWWNYNGMDTISTAAGHPKQLIDLAKQINEETYDRQRKLIKPLIYMGEKGIRIDVNGMIEFKDKENAELEQLTEDFKSIVGYDINPNSPQQLAKYFYTEQGLKPYKAKGTDGKWHVSTNVDALKRIARLGVSCSKAAKLMLTIRSLSKRISTYLNIGKIDNDGRYRSAYNPVGAETGRLSSGKTIFGTGGNQQNWPHDLLRFFMFDSGYIGYSIDLSQIENRIVAYTGGVIEQIRAFKNGIDLHRLTASIIFGKPYEEISDKDGSSDLGDGRQSERYWGKKGNHGINYDESYIKFALVNEMSESEAKYTLEKIHRGYPQIRFGYHAMIKDMLQSSRIITNLMGRRRLFLGPVIVAVPNSPKNACQNTWREGYAQLPQSTTADKINEQGVEYIYYNQHLFSSVELLTQIHDSVVFQVPLSLPWIEHAKILTKIKNSLETPLQWKETEIPTPADIAIGFNMCKEDMKEIKSKDYPSTDEKVAEKLKEIYNDFSETKL